MKLLTEFDPSDRISQLLRVVRVRSTVYCRSLLGAPWGFGVDAHGNPAFHVVTSGRCWLDVDGEAQQVLLVAGDLAVLPTGPRHWLRDEPSTPATELEEILATTPLDGHRRLHHGGSDRQTALLCGGFSLEGATTHPMLRALPSAFVIRGSNDRPVPWLGATLEMLSAETDSDAPGAEEVVARLADGLLTQALRLALVELGGRDESRVLALGDPQIAAAIALLHSQPGRAWTVGELAAEVALSRSELAARFRTLVGESPLRYITRTRLVHAAALLRTTDASLGHIAACVGYGNQFSFSKAFKRTFGIAPGAYRGDRNGVPNIDIAEVPRKHATA